MDDEVKDPNEMEEKGFARSGLNPFMFPGEEV